jgi:hypothetical protein
VKTLMALTLSVLLIGALAATKTIAAEEKSQAIGQETYTLYQFKGRSKAVALLNKRIKADSRFKEQGCEDIGKHESRYVCKKNDANTQILFQASVTSGVQLDALTTACPTGCVYTHCPPPSGPYRCCNTTTYQPCT